jgi:hypothetical protein
MRNLYVLAIVVIFLSGCSTTSIKSSESLNYNIDGKTYNSKKELISNSPTEMVKAIDGDGNEYISVRSQGRYLEFNSFSIHYLDEYVELIDKYLAKLNNNSEGPYVGLAHTTWKNVRLGFTVINNDNEDLLNIDGCVVGACGHSGLGGIFYDEENARKLKNYLNEEKSESLLYSTAYTDNRLPADDKAAVYVYKMNSTPLLGDTIVTFNGEMKGVISKYKYFRIEIDPGEYEVKLTPDSFTFGDNSFSKKIPFEQGKTYYLKYSSLATPTVDRTVYLMVGAEHDEVTLKVESATIAKNDLLKCEETNEGPD